MTLSHGARNTQEVCRFFHRKTSKITKLDQLSFLRVFVSQMCDCLVQGQNIVARGCRERAGMIEVEPLAISAVLGASLATGVVDQNPPHGFSRGRKKMSPAIPMLALFAAYEPQIDFVHERRRLERL